MDSPERPFAADYATTLDRLIDEAGEAQDGRAVRIFQRFRETPFRGFAALYPRPYDPGESPLTGGPVLDQRWEEDAFDLFERATAAQAALPADADRRSRRSAQFFRGLTEVLWRCFDDEAWAQAIRAEAYALALGQLENADRDHVRFHRDFADEARAGARLTNSVDVVGAVVEFEGDAEHLARSVRELGAASKTYERAVDRSMRSWARVKAGRRPGIPSAVIHPRSRGRRRRAAARRASGPRSGQDPGGDDDPEPVGVPPSPPADDQGAS